MQQYREIKSRHQDAILFFRMGEFYEMFYEDAEVASRTLGLTLTSRNNGGASEVPLAGVPVKAAGEYLRRLIQQLGEAIHESVSESEQISEVVQDIRKQGFDVLLMLEATIGLNEVEQQPVSELEAPPSENLQGDETFNAQDVHFLRSLRISVEEE